jgi:lysozyme family protein
MAIRHILALAGLLSQSAKSCFHIMLQPKSITPFEAAYQFVRSMEGGHANHPYDYGGQTYAGISRKAWPYWPGWKYIDEGKNVPEELVEEFYRKRFWDALQCDKLPPAVAFILFDSAVGSGHVIPVKWLQGIIGAKKDGIVGPETIRKSWEVPADTIVAKMIANRLAFYTEIVIRDPRQMAFLCGWLRRTMELNYAIRKNFLRA